MILGYIKRIGESYDFDWYESIVDSYVPKYKRTEDKKDGPFILEVIINVKTEKFTSRILDYKFKEESAENKKTFYNYGITFPGGTGSNFSPFLMLKKFSKKEMKDIDNIVLKRLTRQVLKSDFWATDYLKRYLNVINNIKGDLVKSIVENIKTSKVRFVVFSDKDGFLCTKAENRKLVVDCYKSGRLHKWKGVCYTCKRTTDVYFFNIHKILTYDHKGYSIGWLGNDEQNTCMLCEKCYGLAMSGFNILDNDMRVMFSKEYGCYLIPLSKKEFHKPLVKRIKKTKSEGELVSLFARIYEEGIVMGDELSYFILFFKRNDRNTELLYYVYVDNKTFENVVKIIDKINERRDKYKFQFWKLKKISNKLYLYVIKSILSKEKVDNSIIANWFLREEGVVSLLKRRDLVQLYDDLLRILIELNIGDDNVGDMEEAAYCLGKLYNNLAFHQEKVFGTQSLKKSLPMFLSNLDKRKLLLMYNACMDIIVKLKTKNKTTKFMSDMGWKIGTLLEKDDKMVYSNAILKLKFMIGYFERVKSMEEVKDEERDKEKDEESA